MAKITNEYRCTRNQPYSHDCTGNANLGARQGYYVDAISAMHAYAQMCLKFPKEIEQGFTIELCLVGCEDGIGQSLLRRICFSADGDNA